MVHHLGHSSIYHPVDRRIGNIGTDMLRFYVVFLFNASLSRCDPQSFGTWHRFYILHSALRSLHSTLQMFHVTAFGSLVSLVVCANVHTYI